MNRSDAITDLLDSVAARDTLYVFGSKLRILAEYGATDDDMCLLYAEMGPGVFVPLHSHDDIENLYVVRGAVQLFRYGEGWVEKGAGASFSVVDGSRHALRNCGDVPVSGLIVTTVRIARFFRAIGMPSETMPAGPPSPEAFGQLADAARHFGYWLGSPMDNAAIGLRMG